MESVVPDVQATKAFALGALVGTPVGFVIAHAGSVVSFLERLVNLGARIAGDIRLKVFIRNFRKVVFDNFLDDFVPGVANPVLAAFIGTVVLGAAVVVIEHKLFSFIVTAPKDVFVQVVLHSAKSCAELAFIIALIFVADVLHVAVAQVVRAQFGAIKLRALLGAGMPDAAIVRVGFGVAARKGAVEFASVKPATHLALVVALGAHMVFVVSEHPVALVLVRLAVFARRADFLAGVVGPAIAVLQVRFEIEAAALALPARLVAKSYQLAMVLAEKQQIAQERFFVLVFFFLEQRLELANNQIFPALEKIADDFVEVLKPLVVLAN